MTQQIKWHTEKHQRFIPHESGGPGGSFEGVNSWFWLIVHEDESQPQLRTPIAEVTISTEDEAHARLIAAAPELLEACLKAKTCGSLPDAVWDMINAAIAKATNPS